MGGEGTMAAMNASLKNNRNLRNQRRNAYNSEQKEPRTGSYNKALRFKRVSAVKLERIKRRIREERRQDATRVIKALIATGMILIGIVLLVRLLYL